ncbi:protein bark beetle-like [Branchiostoma lanceolatum]|uniref:protein bark beetle-like n=1 Tax=Branchiostoma lanceolatum TaxID=7740 RepID=UPI003451A9C3
MKCGVKCGVHLLVVLFHLAVAQEIEYVIVYVTQVGGSYYQDLTLPLSGSPYVATQEIIVGRDATLTVEAGVEILFNAGVGMTVVGQLHAVGSADKRIVFDRRENPPDDPVYNITRDPNVRLVGPTVNRGRLEIRHDGQWGTVACRHLGFVTGRVDSQYRYGKGRMSMSDLECFGNEGNLYECNYREMGTAPDCDLGGSRRDLGVVCEGISRVNSVFWNGIRLVPSSAGKVSRLEHVDVLHAGQDDGTGTTAAISIKTYSPVLRDVNIKYSAGAGVKVQGATTVVNIADCSIEENQGPGIIIEDQAADVNIQNTRVSKNFPYGAQVTRGSHGHKIALTDSVFTENFGTGLLLDTVRSDIVLSGSDFSSNTHFGLDSINSQLSTLVIQSCTLNSNGLDGVLIQQSTIAFTERSFSIDQSLLSENLRRGVTVSIMYPSYNSRDHKTFFHVTGSEVNANLEGAIDISVEGSTSTCYPSVLLDNTDFKTNGGDVVRISGSWSDVEVRNDVFQENTCGPNSVLFVTGQGKNVSCSSNTFQQNVCKRLGLFNVTELADVNNIQQTFTENIFTDNDYDPPFLYKSDPLRDYCTLEFSGEWRPISVTHNSFPQDVSRFDLCSTVWTNSWDGPTIDATHNWWGTDDEEVIREKIFDYNDWNSGAQVTYSPFLDSAVGNPVDAIVNPNPTAQAFGGLLFNDLHIPKESSPVLMKSDLTILPDATLTLDPGVEVEAAPGVGILNYGHINMVGSETDPIILGAQRNDNMTSNANDLRLSGNGLEVLHAGTWKSVCYDNRNWESENEVIACRQLGLGPPRSVRGTSFGPLQKVVVRCDGWEESLQLCNFYDVAPDWCSQQARVTCEPTPGWGGIRSHGQDKTKVEHILFKDIGQLHNRRSSALSIESIDGAMTLQNIEIDRCLQSRAGVEIVSPPSQTTVQHLTASACEAESVLSVTNATDSVTINNVSIMGTGGRVLSTAGIRVESLDRTYTGPTVAIYNTLATNNNYGIKLTGGHGNITVENSEARSNDHGMRIEQWTGDVEITRVNAAHHTSYGVSIYGSTGNVMITQITARQNSYGVGISHSRGDVEITQVNASQNSYGVEISHSMGNVVINQVNVEQNLYGVDISNSRGNAIITEVNTGHSSYGVRMSSWTGNVTISDVTTGRSANGVYIDGWTGHGTISQVKSGGIYLSSSNGIATLMDIEADGSSNGAIHINTDGGRYFVTNTTVSSSSNFGMVVSLRGDSRIHVDDVKFQGNKRGGARISTQTSGAQGQEVTITNSVFHMNKRFALHMSGIASKVEISQNTFQESICPHAGAIVVSAAMQNVSFNRFIHNNARRTLQSNVLQWSNNIRESECLIVDNVFIDNFYSHEDTDGNFRYDNNIRNTSCTLQLDGYRRAIRFHRNVFENPRVDHQVCSNIPSRSAEDFVDGRFNWWGTTVQDSIRDAIFDFDDQNDHAGVAYLPYLTSSDVSIVPPTNPVNNTDMPLPLLLGRLHSDLHLTRNNSPYTLTSDLTILPNVTLTIDPGVEVQAYPCVGLLNLGTLIANGTKQQPISFGLTSGVTDKPSLYRLTDGKNPWEGKVEVFFEGRWCKVCSRYFDNDDINILCRELGYGPPIGISGYAIGSGEESVTSGYNYITCQGDEEKLVHCYQRASVFTRTSCSNRNGRFVKCTPVSTHSTIPDATCTSDAWGGLRMASDESFLLNHVQISGSGTLHSKPASGLSIEKSGGHISNVLITNCTGSGLEIFGPGSDTTIIDSEIHQCQANTGIVICGSQSEVHVSRVTVTNNSFVTGGVSILSWEQYVDRENFENVIGICDSEEDVFLTAGAYFVYETKSGQCVKHIHAGKGKEIYLRVIEARLSELRVYSDVNQQNQLGEVNNWNQNNIRVFHSPEVISLNVRLSSDDDVYLEVQITRSSGPSRRTITDSVFSNNSGTVVNIATLSEAEVVISRTSIMANTQRNGKDLRAATIFLNTNDIHCTIHNNYFFDNSMNGLVGRNLGGSELALVHNAFDTNYGQGSVDLTNDGTGDCQALISGNEFVSNDASFDFSTIKLGNTKGTVNRNRFQRNIGLYVVDWQVRDNIRQSQIFIHNRLEHNSGQRPGYKHTVAVSGPDVQLHQNVLINPANDAELIALNTWSSAHVDATNNWWGFNQSTIVATRIRDSKDQPELPDVLFEPFLEEDPEKGEEFATFYKCSHVKFFFF